MITPIKHSLIITSFFFSFIIYPGLTMSAEIGEIRGDGVVGLVFDGSIIEGDSFRLIPYLASNEYKFIVLDSSGGQLVEGLLVAKVIEDSGIDTIIMHDSNCASVCAIIFMAGENRYIFRGGRLGVHAPFLPSEQELQSKLDPSANVKRSTRNLHYRKIVFELARRQDIDKIIVDWMFLYNERNVKWIDYSTGLKTGLFTRVIE